MAITACSGIGLHILTFTIKHPLKKKYMEQAPYIRFTDHASTAAFGGTGCETSNGSVFFTPDRFFGHTAGEIPGSIYQR